MKKALFYLFVVSYFVVGCKSTTPVTNTKLDNKTEVALKGNWKITEVSFPGSNYIKITSFNIADSKCFVGSQWKFISNNNKGEMILTASACDPYGSHITWYINKEGNMVMKFLSDGVKAKHTTSGYILKVVNVTSNSFQLIDKMDVGGQIVEVVYQFNKNM
ncbi:hypothetical protein GFJ94_07040 [Flavobacterium sp. LMO8]|uniref:lipocalin family protein n=1 Tax=Flavobacterium sp. LMO8 TaxID=2654244 RepID=UPI0012920F1B|nr:lipocalin family protein [Flavobacterium sp. LMO8]MQP24818.1 hypothetical protein [Flavobacterium sp. LMO8]